MNTNLYNWNYVIFAVPNEGLTNHINCLSLPAGDVLIDQLYGRHSFVWWQHPGHCRFFTSRKVYGRKNKSSMSQASVNALLRGWGCCPSGPGVEIRHYQNPVSNSGSRWARSTFGFSFRSYSRISVSPNQILQLRYAIAIIWSHRWASILPYLNFSILFFEE